MQRYFSLWVGIVAVYSISLVRAQNTEPQTISLSQQRTVSRSKQFITYSEEQSWRSGVTLAAEETKTWLLRKLRLQDEWQTPIVITIVHASTATPEQKPMNLRILETEIGPKIQLDIAAGPTEKPISFRKEILRALLTEISLRGQTAEDAQKFKLPPEWVVDGLAALQASEDDESSKASFYAALLQSKTHPNLQDFIHLPESNMSSTNLKIYEGYAAALLYTLMDLPNGRTGLVSFLQKRARPATDEIVDLRSSIPSIGTNQAGIEKWWTLGLARLSTGNRYEKQSFSMTTEKLPQVLEIHLQNKEGKEKKFTLQDFDQFKKYPDLKSNMAGVVQRIQLFSATANPLYLPILNGYAKIALEIAAGKTGKVNSNITELREMQIQIEKLGNDVTDYMNWIEATQPAVPSGDFDAYLHSTKQKENPLPRRKDAISRYLDSVEMEME